VRLLILHIEFIGSIKLIWYSKT